MDVPFRLADPEQIAPDTHVIRGLFGEGVNPVAVLMNSMVIAGDEPVIVDTGAAISRKEWLDTVFGIVDPADVRWIFLSHDDTDHTGNLLQVLELAPKATLVTNWFSVERMAADYALPLDRMRWVNDGESFRAGDRELVAVVPPNFDGPTTRGLYDTKTGVYWAADSLANPVPHDVTSIRDLDPGFYREGFLQFQRLVSPWLQWADATRFQSHLDRVAALGATTVASAHGTTLRGDEVAQAFELMRELPGMPPAEVPGQADLEAIIAAVSAVAPAA